MTRKSPFSPRVCRFPIRPMLLCPVRLLQQKQSLLKTKLKRNQHHHHVNVGAKHRLQHRRKAANEQSEQCRLVGLSLLSICEWIHTKDTKSTAHINFDSGNAFVHSSVGFPDRFDSTMLSGSNAGAWWHQFSETCCHRFTCIRSKPKLVALIPIATWI